ncbi:hypothetical protein RRG08_041417 [Elysia crispata]|uniref:Uncharacterized protein n=1 Tax=Elysia crispata TaxID=231223 RepID=A0AAE0XR53_9GAST|nr:hypothetical protein RRG08_041417 [Elysia crispata]
MQQEVIFIYITELPGRGCKTKTLFWGLSPAAKVNTALPLVVWSAGRVLFVRETGPCECGLCELMISPCGKGSGLKKLTVENLFSNFMLSQQSPPSRIRRTSRRIGLRTRNFRRLQFGLQRNVDQMFITRVGCQCLSDYHYKSQTLCYEKYRVATGEVLTRAYMLGVCSTRINTRRKTGKYPVCRKLKSQTTSLPGRMADNVTDINEFHQELAWLRVNACGLINRALALKVQRSRNPTPTQGRFDILIGRA